MDFVIEVLEKIFRKNHTQSTEIMLKIHNEGKGVCGTYPKEIAETKMTQVVDKARHAVTTLFVVRLKKTKEY